MCQELPPTRPLGPSSWTGYSPSREGPGEVLEVCKPHLGMLRLGKFERDHPVRPGLISCKQNTPLFGRKMAYQQLEHGDERQRDRRPDNPVRHLGGLIGRIDQLGHLREDLHVLVVVSGL